MVLTGTQFEISLLSHITVRVISYNRREQQGSLKRLDTWQEEIGAALDGREGRQPLYLSSDWPLWDRHIVGAVLSADHRIAFIAQFVEVRIVHPDVLYEFELADEAGADHERCNTAIGSILWMRLDPNVPRRSTGDSYFCRANGVHPADMRTQRNGVTLGVHLRIVEVVIALRIIGKRHSSLYRAS